MSDIKKKALSPREVAETYGLSVGTLNNWRYQKRGPKYHRISRRKIIYFVTDVEAYLKRCTVLTVDSLDQNEIE